MNRVSLHTLGCKLNYAETSTIAREFISRDYEVVPFGNEADVTVINTCTVTDQANKKCRNAIRKAKKANPKSYVIVSGCYAQLEPEEIAEIEGVDAVLGNTEKFKIFEIIDEFEEQSQTQIHVSCIDESEFYGQAFSSGDRTRVFLKVQDGCDYTCSFCTIPLARGKSRSLPLEETVKHAMEVADLGHKEIVLSGINLGLYGLDSGSKLIDLLKRLDEIEKIERFRISSIEPNLLSEDIIDFVAQSRAFMPHFHIPLQSGDDFVLGKMRRRYKTDLYRGRIEKIKELIPDAGIGVDVIVGFPAEGTEEFSNTVTFIESLAVSYLHVFTYSERDNTSAVDHAEKMGGPVVDLNERHRRSRILRSLSHDIQANFNKSFLGRSRPVLWEKSKKSDVLYGFTDNYIKVKRNFDSSLAESIQMEHLDTMDENGIVQVVEDQAIELPLLT